MIPVQKRNRLKGGIIDAHTNFSGLGQLAFSSTITTSFGGDGNWNSASENGTKVCEYMVPLFLKNISDC